MTRILIAEDEPRIASFIQKGLKANSFTTAVASNGVEAITLALDYDFDLILLDLCLPDKDGLTVLEELRGQGLDVPIIILSARDDLNNKVTGLEGGANDYVTKPFRFEELLARIRLRLCDRIQPTQKKESLSLTVGKLSLDLRTHKVQKGNQEIELSAKEFVLLEIFMRHPGQIMTREQLLDHVWGYDYDPGSNVVDVYVGYLRKKLGSKLIETVRGVGYRLAK